MVNNDSEWKEGVSYIVKNNFFHNWIKATSSEYMGYFYVDGLSGIFGANEYYKITE